MYEGRRAKRAPLRRIAPAGPERRAVRLHKVLANAGVASRRACEALIRQGRVTVDGAVAAIGEKVDPATARIEVDGEPVRPAALAPSRPRSYLLLYKPRGVVCTSGEEPDRARRAIDFAPAGSGRLYCVGRLDKESEGLVILTDDGALTERLTHPRHELEKRYRVRVRGDVSEEAAVALRGGIRLAEGKARAATVRVLGREAARAPSLAPATTLEIVLTEGKNRQIRRMLAKVGHAVKHLERIGIGPIRAGSMRPGEIRALTSPEVEALRAWADLA